MDKRKDAASERRRDGAGQTLTDVAQALSGHRRPSAAILAMTAIYGPETPNRALVDSLDGLSLEEALPLILGDAQFITSIVEPIHAGREAGCSFDYPEVDAEFVEQLRQRLGFIVQPEQRAARHLRWPAALRDLFKQPTVRNVATRLDPVRFGEAWSRQLDWFAGEFAWSEALRDGYDDLRDSPLFDAEHYRLHNPDIAAAGVDPVRHFLMFGAWEGRNPSARFDTKAYLRRRPEVAASGLNPLVHHLTHGRGGGFQEPAPQACGAPSLPLPEGEAWRRSFESRLAERLARLTAANLTPPLEGAGPTFSIVTTVEDTDPSLLTALADSVVGQAFRDWEWLVLDNGSASKPTIAACRNLAERDDRIRCWRVDARLEDVDAHRFVFGKGDGKYVLPVGGDDLLYPDALALFAEALRSRSDAPPSLLYSDDQEIDAFGRPLRLTWHWPISMARAMATAAVPHLTAFSRTTGVEVGVYSDSEARGAPHLDAMLRLLERGETAHQIPEVLCGRRVRDDAPPPRADRETSARLPHAAFIERSLKRRGLDESHTLRETSLDGHRRFHVSRDRRSAPAVAVDIVLQPPINDPTSLVRLVRQARSIGATTRVLYWRSLGFAVDGFKRTVQSDAVTWLALEGQTALADALREIGDDVFAKIVLRSDVALAHEDALLHAVATLELDTRCGIVGGPILRDSAFVTAGLTVTSGDPLTPIFTGCAPSQVRDELWMTPRRVAALPVTALAIRAEVLRAGVGIGGIDSADCLHGAKLCLKAARSGFTTVYSSSMEVALDHAIPVRSRASAAAFVALEKEFGAELAELRCSPHLTSDPAQFGRLKSPREEGRMPRASAAEIPPAVPLNLEVDPALAGSPTINLLLPGIGLKHMSGGPNTALNLAYRLAANGFALRLFSTDIPPDADHGPVWKHIVSLGGGETRPPHMEIVDGSDRTRAVRIGANDIFLATAWWTAQMANWASPLVGGKPFVYLIQDFEPILYPASSAYALALETYSFDHVPVINTRLLADYLRVNEIGRFAEPRHADGALILEPAVDPQEFFFEDAARGGDGPRTLLFYARPTKAERNLFATGVAALQTAIARGSLEPGAWRFLGMGEAFSPVPLGGGAVLEQAPWLGFKAYAEQMRSADLLLSLMMSPHPSYPPLEMATSGGLVVTNVYANKNAAALAELSGNIIGVEPTIEAIAQALADAEGRLGDLESRRASARTGLPATWEESFAPVLDGLQAQLRALDVLPDAAERPRPGEPVRLAKPAASDPRYADFLRETAERRRYFADARLEPGLLSFVSTVWNTAPAFLQVLADSVRAQDAGHDFEWVILDNGSSRPDTLTFLQKLAEEPYVRLERVDKNLGIIGGMRRVLELATGRYILPLDSDDYLYPDCIRTLTWHIQKAGYPPLLYTDEDKLMGEDLFLPYLKPDFDPVLFSASCFIAHLTAIDRAKALELGAYSDPATEGSHDWDTFTRFSNAGHRPVHVPAVLYSWRMHPLSTAGDIDSKPVVYDSQTAVLQRFLDGNPRGELFTVERSPLYGRTPDWWLRRRRVRPRTIETVRLAFDGGEGDQTAGPAITLSSAADAQASALAALERVLQRLVEAGSLAHFSAPGLVPDNDEWRWEATGWFDLRDDVVGVGGRLHSYGSVLEAGRFLGFGDGCGCPDRGSPLQDSGYFSQLWKPRSVDAVSLQHAVFDPAFVLEALQLAKAHGGSVQNLGSWIGLHARRAGRRIVCSPIISAQIGTDLDALVSAEERGRLVAAAPEILVDPGLRSPHLGRSSPDDRSPVADPRSDPWANGAIPPAYPAWLDETTLNAPAETEEAAAVTLSLLTTVYVRTDAALFRETVTSVLSQSHARLEWVVLAHGPITPELDDALRDAADDRRVRVLRLSENLGIIGGMRHVLEKATGDYVVPLDADDLLAPGILAELATFVVENGRPGYVFTDEDLLIANQPAHPYLRPDWDPVLDLENSWIWHIGAYRRDLAMDLGVYSDRGSEFCHDWDTVWRFSAAGHAPLHLREIGHHWRQHERSTSNTGGEANDGSSRSVQHLLGRKIASRGLEDQYRVSPSPIWRGAPEWRIERTNQSRPPLHAFRYDRWGLDLPPIEGFSVVNATRAGFVEDFKRWASALSEDAVALVTSTDVALREPLSAAGEAIKFFDFVDDLAAVSGRVVRRDRVIGAGFCADEEGRLYAPMDGKLVADAGPYALFSKPHGLTAPVSNLVFVKSAFVKQAADRLPTHITPAELGLWLGACAAADGLRVGYSPLIVADADPHWPGDHDPISSPLSWRACQEALGGPREPARRGAVGWEGWLAK